MIDLRLPKNEDRPHEVFFLENGLQVTAVSDPDADQAAAALDVRVGSLSDPKDTPGMAHFCEHMLFLGTEKYPDENSYSSFLQKHGGHSNAYTAGENTNYYFDVVHNHLEEALDRFSQFFIAPLFTESATDRERNAIDSEHSKNLQNDTWRVHQLLKSQVNKEHPFANFGTGNLFTLKEEPERLGIDMKARLFEFYKQHYSASIMKLAVVGRDPLPTLKEWITSKFSPIKTTGISPPYPPWRDPNDPTSLTKGPKLISEKEKNLLIKVVPVKEARQLRLLFPVPPQSQNYRKNPSHYVSHLLGHEGKGSILSVLKARGIGNSLCGGITTSQTDFAVFSVSVDLSEKGFERWEEVAGIIFQSIRELQKEGPKEWVFKELKAMGEIEFEMKEKSPSTSYVGFLTSAMQLYAPEDVVSGAYLLHDYDPELIKNDILNNLTTENCIGLLISPDFAATADSEERWYKVKYSLGHLSAPSLEAWGKDKYSDDLHEPTPNDFIPTDLDLKPVADGGEDKEPELVYETPLSRLHHKQDTQFKLPKMNLYLQFCVPIAHSSPWGSVATSLFVRLCEDELNQFAYDATIAGLSFTVLSTWSGIRLVVKGFNEKLDTLTLKILDTMFQLMPAQDRFDTLKEVYIRELKNFAIAQPYEHGRYYSDLLNHQTYWSVDDTLPQLERLKIDDVIRIKESLFTSVKIEGLMHGNITSLEAVDFMKKIETRFSESIPLPLSQQPDRRIVQVPTGKASIFTKKGLSPKEVNSCLYLSLQVGPESVEANSVADLFAQLLREPAFDQLRTKEQLGYIVFSSVHSAHCVQGIRVIVQSCVADPLFLEQRIEAFLSGFGKVLEEMTEETLQTNIKSLIARKLEKYRNLSQESNRHWDTIIRKKPGFNMRELEAEAVGKLKKDDILNFFNTYIAQDSPQRKKISIQIFGCNHSIEDAGKGPRELDGDFLKNEEREQITDYAAWKRGLVLYKNDA